jgi:5-methyltetrahydropteroyltriglutamate--homocysteine methyltransferase
MRSSDAWAHSRGNSEVIRLPKIFPTQEIGSLPKFSWRTKPFRRLPLSDLEVEAAEVWGERLGVPGRSDLTRILSKRANFTDEEKRRIVDFSLLYAIRMEETAGGEGLDLVWSGEQARTEMYETPVSNIAGFEFIGKVRSFDNKYWRMASIRSPPSYKTNYHMAEFLFTKKHAKRKVKVPVTDAITIMSWSDNNFYTAKWAKERISPLKRSFSARREFTLELAKIVRRVIRELVEGGVEEVQIDIPAATQYQSQDDIKLVTEAFNETTKGISATFSMHSCFPPSTGYAILFPHLLEMKKCERFSFEYGNRDTFRRGVDGDARVGFADLKLFREYGYRKELGVGVIHVHTDVLPSVNVVRDRILHAAKVTDLAPENLYVNPDCGLRTRSPEVAQSMLDLVVAGAEKARSDLPGP